MDLMLRASVGFQVLPFLLRNPRQVRYLKAFRQSYWSNAFDDRQPWIAFAARDWLSQTVTSTMNVFEFGSGGSTLYLASRVRSLVSVEHNAKWYAKVRDELTSMHATNVEYHLRTRESANFNPRDATNQMYYSSRFDLETGCYRDYVQTIDQYDDESFDIVFIDGRARNACAIHALPKVKQNGYLILDNTDRRDYDPTRTLLQRFRSKTFGGLCPYCNVESKTTVWTVDRKPASEVNAART